MKTKTTFVIAVILIFGGLLSPGDILSQVIRDHITGKASMKKP